MSFPPLEKSKQNIRVLSEDIANKIAAGEVVERPASVVKELVENSIDAGAGRILIEIESAGKERIKVTDNGIGMSPEDASLAFARHATSKISQPDDLGLIQTLGFRGEALPSIASVAKVYLSTTDDEHRPGSEVSLEGGSLKGVKEIACPRGTTIDVRQLFYNTPVRKKFLKGDVTESSHISQVVTQQALAHPEIHFTLTQNGRKVIDTLSTEHTLYRVAELFGSELTKELVRVEKSNEDYRLEGYVSNPVYTRSNRSAQFFYINKRFIRDKVILHAIQHGFSHLLPRGRYPVLFLFLEMDPGLVDVNVHPAKAEVRFAYQQEVHRFVSEGIREGLTGNKQTSEPPLAREKRSTGDQGSSRQTINLPTDWKGRENPLLQNAPYPKEEHRDLSRAMDLFYKGPTGQPDPSSSTLPPQQMQSFDQKPLPVSGLIYSDFQTLGQLDNSFIIMQGKKGIVVVDQHIAHERVLYERFREAAKNKKVEVQQLLFPLAVEFTAGEAQLLNAHLDLLKDLGMELEPFGENGFLLRAVPAILKHDDHEEILREIVETLSSRGKVDSLQEKFDEVTIMMACRNAIKINQPMDKDQINKLIYDLEQTEMPYTCPHGRPISLFFDMEDILKKFLRK